MTPTGAMQIALYLGALLALAWPLRIFMARVYSGERTWLSPVIEPVERLVYRVAGVDRNGEHTWRQYTAAALAFSLVGFVVVCCRSACREACR